MGDVYAKIAKFSVSEINIVPALVTPPSLWIWGAGFLQSVSNSN